VILSGHYMCHLVSFYCWLLLHLPVYGYLVCVYIIWPSWIKLLWTSMLKSLGLGV
jgi:hypothetical protein